jgi:fatty acid desaturase
MDEVFARRDLIDAATLKSLCRPSDARGALQVFSHVGVLLCTGWLLWRTWGSAWVIPLFIVHGALLNFLYAGQHELSHWTVFRTRWLNEWCGRLFGFVVFYPRTFDQVQHVAHHRFTQDWERDGELARPRFGLTSYLLWMSGITYWYTRWRRIIRFSMGVVTEPYLPESRHPEFVREARWHLAGYGLILTASIYGHNALAAQLWLAPMLAMKFIHQLQNTIEHLGMSHEPNVFANTRSTRTNAVMRWACWQMQYHTAHHAFPGVPFYRLKTLDRLLTERRGAAPITMSYLAFQWEVLKSFAHGRTESDYPDREIWIGQGQ